MKKKIALKGDLSHMLVNPSAGLVLCAMIAMNGGVMADPKKELHLRRSEPLRSTRNAMVAWSIRKEKKVKKPDVSQNNMSPSPSFQVRPAINEAGRLDLCEGKYTSFKKGLLGHL